jgi:Transglutaminase-like superfamily
MGPPYPSRISVAHRRMNAPQKVVLVSEILVVYARVRSLMRRDDIRDVVDVIRAQPAIRTAPATAGPPETWLTAARLANAVNRALKALPTDTRCLSQSLVLLWVLSRRGIPSTLVIGAHTSPEFAAHAWIEHTGRPLLNPCGFSDDRLVEI